MFVTFSDKRHFRIKPGDTRRAIMLVAVGDGKRKSDLCIHGRVDTVGYRYIVGFTD